MSNLKNQFGFTLVELSIVLVIIGLIVGGILTGQDLINAAKVRAQVSQLTQYSTAVNAFHEKYSGLPGDLLSAGNYFSGISSQSATIGRGNGDGIIQPVNNNFGWYYGEVLVFWYELSQAGLITDPNVGNSTYDPIFVGGIGGTYGNITNDTPQSKTPGVNISIYPDSNGNHYWILSSLHGTPTVPDFAPGLNVIQASQIDGKIDDGLPSQGRVVSIAEGGNGGPAGPESPGTPGDAGCYFCGTPGGSTSCVTDANFNASTAYNVAKYANAGNCAISIAVSF